MKRVLFCLLLLLVLMPLSALPRIAYIGMSAVLPGSGEIALGKVNRGTALLGMDVLALTSYWAVNRQEDLLLDSYRQYAQAYAGVAVNSNEIYYGHVRQYLSSDDFNAYQEMMARNYYLVTNYDPAGYAEYMQDNTYGEDQAWNWQSEEHLEQFRQKRSRYMKMKLFKNASLGVVFLNRMISMIDVVFISRTPSGGTALYFSQQTPDSVMLNYRLEF